MIAMDEAIRILLLDSHTLFRESLCHLLQAEPEFHVVGSCGSVAEALGILEREYVDIVLFDNNLGDEHGLTFQRKARRNRFKGRVLIVTDRISDQDVVQVLENGASGIFLKNSASVQLTEAIRKVMKGEPSLDPKAISAVISAATARSGSQKNSRALTAREHAVLEGIFEGFTNAEISEKLKISVSSVKNVIRQLFHKAGVRTRSQLVRIALEKGQIESRVN
jgi:DNA-binding NarL/FixJ family response regulator